MSLSPTSRFALGLLDLFGVKQMGQYPNSISQEMIPTIEQLQFVLVANSISTFTDLPLNLFGVGATAASKLTILEQLGVPLITSQRECLIITAWSAVGSTIGVGGSLPDFRIGYQSSSTGGENQYFGNQPYEAALAAAATQVVRLKGEANCFYYVPPGSTVYLHTLQNAVSVAGGDCKIGTVIRFLRLNI